MNDIITKRMGELAECCEKRGVARLWLFGSAAAAGENTQPADLDFLVEFRDMPPARVAESFFGLQHDLQTLFGLPVDLVEPGPIRNPYFLKSVQQTRVILYDAA